MSALTEIEKLVNEVAKAALAKEEGTIAFHDKVDALKVLTPYYLALRKDHADIEIGDTMADFAKTLKEFPDARFEVVDEMDEPSPMRESLASTKETIPPQALEAILLGLKALPKRIALALHSCFVLLTVATVFCLSLMIIPYEPSTYQLAGLTGYALFVIAINIIRRSS